MSNHLAVAATTRTLAQLLDEPLTRDVTGAHVIPGRPDTAAGDDADPEVRLFLYRIEPNASWRSSALPTRSPAGRVYERPQIALTLQYLLSFIGNESQLAPQRMLGSVVRTLCARPLLSRADIDAMVAAALAEDPNHPLGLTDLADQPETIRLSALPLTLEELGTLWSSFFDAPYRLSVAYEANVVVLTADDIPTRALPVRERRLTATTIQRPRITSAQGLGGPSAPLQVGTQLVLTGHQLAADELTVVALGGTEVNPAPTDVTSSRIEVTVPAGVRAGVVGVRVIHRRQLGDPPTARLAGQSNAFPVTIQPRLQSPTGIHEVTVDDETGLRSGRLSLSVEPAAGSRQQIVVLLNALPGGSGNSYVFADERRDGEGNPEQTAALDVTFTGVAAGSYLLRLSVDGAESPLEVDQTEGSPTHGQYIRPVVVVP